MRTMNSDALPAQPEDFREILAWICKTNWIAIAVALGLELFIRQSDFHAWPHWGYFSLTYNLALVEFAVINFGIMAMLQRTAWLDSAPREALARLRWLLLAVLVLDGLHLIGFFRMTGGLQGPVMLLLLPVLMSLYLLLPRSDAKLAVPVFLAFLLLESLFSSATNTSQGMLAEAFSPGNEHPLPWMLVAAMSLLLAVVVGVRASKRMATAGISLSHHLQRDPLTGLLTRNVLERRLVGELGRIGRIDSSASLLLISFRNIHKLLPHGDYAGFEAMVRDIARGLCSATRETSDTCARYDATVFAALLPTTSAETVTLVIRRIQAHADAVRAEGSHKAGVALACGVACMSTSSQVDAIMIMNAAEQALQAAQASDQEGHQQVTGEL